MQSYREFLLARMSGVGGSDVAGIVGKSPWASPLSVFKDKKIEPDADLVEPDWREWGRRLEPVIADWYAEFNGKGRKLVEARQLVRSESHPWMIANLDYWVECPKRGRGVGEIKNVSAWTAQDWRDGPPVWYFLQMQHYLHVTKCKWGVFILFMGNECRWFEVDANPAVIAKIIEATKEFWDRVENDNPPTADGHKATLEALAELYPAEEKGKAVALPMEATEWDGDIIEAQEQMAELKELVEDRKNKIRQAMGDAETGILEGEQIAYTNKANKNGVRSLRRSDKS